MEQERKRSKGFDYHGCSPVKWKDGATVKGDGKATDGTSVCVCRDGHRSCGAGIRNSVLSSSPLQNRHNAIT